MTWELAVALKILGGSVLAPIVFKLLGDVAPRERFYRIMLQYAWTVVCVAGVALLWGFVPSAALMPIFCIGALMPLAVFFQWKAMAMSPSRTGIFNEATSIIPLLLSAVLLGEWTVFQGNQALIVGFVLVLAGIALQARSDIVSNRKKEGSALVPAAFYGNAIGFTVTFALATFLQNYWAKTGIHTPEFLIAWYLGAFVGAVVLFLATRRLQKSHEPPMPVVWEQSLIFLAAVSIILSLGLQFTAFTLVEQTVALPVMAGGGIVGPILVGAAFGEWKRMRGWVLVYFAIILGGALIMAFSR